MSDEFAASPEFMRAPSLTRLQQEVLFLIVQGYSNQQIALSVGASPGMVGIQIDRIIRRLGLSCRAEIADWASRRLSHADRLNSGPMTPLSGR